MISCEKQKQPRQSSSSGDFAIIIKMKIRIKPDVSVMMPTFRLISTLSPLKLLIPIIYDLMTHEKNIYHGVHIIEHWEKTTNIFN